MSVAAEQLSPVDELLVAAVRCFLTGGDRGEVIDRLGDLSGEQELVLRRADEEGVAGLLAEVVVESEHALAEHRDLTAALRSRHYRIFAHGARTLDLLERLGEAFAAAGVETLALKGAALLADLYRDHLGRRPVSDLDLLVRRGELPRVREVLAGLGLRPLGPRWRGDGVEIDLHVDLARCELLGHRHAAHDFGPDVWQRALPCPVGNPAILVLPPDLQILHLAVHAVKHAFGRWIWLVDLAQLLATARFGELLEAAKKARAERALAYCAELLTRELGVGTPLARAPGLPDLGHLEMAWLRLVAERRSPIGLGRVVAGLSIPRPLDRLTYWREVAFPSARTLREASPHASGVRRRWLGRTFTPRAAQALRLVARSAFPSRGR